MTSALARIAGYGLPGAGEVGRIEPQEFAEVLAAIEQQRLAGHAVRAVCDGALSLDASDEDALFEVHERALALDLRIERLIVAASVTLQRAGIAVRVVKGPSIAHRFYSDPALRSFGDGDLLVQGADFDAAVLGIERLGLRRRFASPRRSFDRRFVKAVTLLDADGLEIDLHRALSPGPYGVLFAAEALFSVPADTVEIGEARVPCLAADLALAHACAHAVLGDAEPRYASVRDVAQLLSLEFDVTSAIATLTRFRLELVARRAVELCERMLDCTPRGPIVDWALQQQGSRADQWYLRSYEPGTTRYATQAAATFWSLPSLRDRAAYAAALAFPDRAYLRMRDQTYARRIVRSTKLVLQGRPR